MPKIIITEQNYQTALRRRQDLNGWYAEAERAEKCGIDCDDLRERAKHLELFFDAIIREYGYQR